MAKFIAPVKKWKQKKKKHSNEYLCVIQMVTGRFNGEDHDMIPFLQPEERAKQAEREGEREM